MRKFLVPVLILCAVSIFGACGRKAPPVPPHLVIPRISDLKAGTAENGIALTWTASDPKADVARTRVLKSAIEVPGDCPGCPRNFEIIADLFPGDVKAEKGLAKFIDYNVKSGFLYSYKLALCDSSGLCGEESNIAEARIGP
ncbi:MAG: hypothetical protein ABFD62_01120 [Syntrophaceae bacterium]